MTKEEMLFKLNMRPELPGAFSDSARKRYADTVDSWYEWLKTKNSFEKNDYVKIVRDKDGTTNGVGSKLIGEYAQVVGSYIDLYGTHGNVLPLTPFESFALEGRVPVKTDDGDWVPLPLELLTKYKIKLCSSGEDDVWWYSQFLEHCDEPKDLVDQQEKLSTPELLDMMAYHFSDLSNRMTYISNLIKQIKSNLV